MYTAFIAGRLSAVCSVVLSEFTKKISKITNKTKWNNKKICIFIGFVRDFIDFLCELTVKTTDHTVASYDSSDFTWKILTV
jgi:hypothetical protein